MIIKNSCNAGEVQPPVFAIVFTTASSPCRISCLWNGVLRRGAGQRKDIMYTTGINAKHEK